MEYMWLLQWIFCGLAALFVPVTLSYGNIPTTKIIFICMQLAIVVLLIAIVNESKLWMPSLICLGLGLMWVADLKMPKSTR